ncbi:MAG: S41 family peptidase [Planctomycetia bacterium]|nr:S41 family peptidase [Planctomycetia bacterium]
MALGLLRQRCWLIVVLLSTLMVVPSVSLAGPKVRVDAKDARQATQVGEDFERTRRWIDAIEHYEASLKKWPDDRELSYGLRRSKIHFGIERRYSDNSFRKSMLTLSRPDALSLFDDVINKIKSSFVDPLSSTSFVAHGTESLYLALASERFLDHHLPDRNSRQTTRDGIARLRETLRKNYWNKSLNSGFAAHQTVSEVAAMAEQTTGLSGTAVVMEYLFGGCNALDDYSNCLTPDRLSDLYDNIDGEFVGLGIEMKAEAGRGLYLVNVLPESPAAEAGLHVGDYIVAIDNIDCRNMSTDEAAGKLKGTPNSRVRLELSGLSAADRRTVNVTRRAVQVKSIPVVKMVDESRGIGYIQMTGFQKSTPAELDDALARLNRQSMRLLIWDVRGNPGGLLTAAVEVLDRFIDNGVLVSTKGRTTDQNWAYSAHRPNSSNVPIVLLTDENSASASEIVAGAIRDHQRGTIVGRKTYGKWSVQSIFPVQRNVGLRLTTAKFYSPAGKTLGKIGVKPDVEVELPEHVVLHRGPMANSLDEDPDIRKALDVARDQLDGRKLFSNRATD